MAIKDKIENLIKEALEASGVAEASFSVEHPTDLKMGDFSTNAAIKYRDKKDEIFAYIDSHKPAEVERVEMAGPGFINFYLSKEFFKNSLGEIISSGESFGKTEHAKGFKVMVEHTQPNPFKALHIGHMMNNAIGEAISRIVNWNGAEVKVASYHGDVGLHAAKAVWGILNGKENAYAEGNKAFDEDENAKQEIIEINKKIYERSDASVNEAYDKGRTESLNQFERIYKILGSEFDFHFFESEAGEIGKKIVQEKIGEVFEESDGAVVYKGEKVGLHTRVFLNSQGLPTYESKEVGLAKIKSEKFPFDLSITITANEQDAFFNVTQAAIGEVLTLLKGRIKHLSHGMLKLPSGKMSSRTGEVISAESLIEEVKERVKGDEGVAIGAIKYMILRQSIGQDIIFDFEKSVSTEGDSGVYLQYAHARANSILEKAGKRGDARGERKNNHEIEKLLYRFPEIVERAGKEYAPNFIVTYLTELAASFNNFYAHEPVLSSTKLGTGEEGPESAYRLAIVEAFKTVMKNGLTVLGIPAPERM